MPRLPAPLAGAQLAGTAFLPRHVAGARCAPVLAVIAVVSSLLGPPASAQAGSAAARATVLGAGKTASAVSAGRSHSCALTSAGEVECWGANGAGQLGDGTTISSSVPVAVKAVRSPAVAVTTGADHTCVLTSAGEIQCWGWNRTGQLGDGSHLERHQPVAVEGLPRATAVTAGSSHTCALTSTGGVRCWGANRYGQLGDGTNTPRSSPVRVRGLSGRVVAINAGGRHTCALTAAGAVECWGANYWGQLGDGTIRGRAEAGAVRRLSGAAVAIATGRYFTCAALQTGSVACWGANFLGQLGNSAQPFSKVPTEVNNLPGAAVAVTAGGRHACALTDEGLVACWGGNGYGQLGDPGFGSSPDPITVATLAAPTLAISAGQYHTCALTGGRGVACWGSNFFGQLGNGARFESTSPVRVAGLSGVVDSVSAGEGHSCALTGEGNVACWGWNRFGQLGDGGRADRPVAGAVRGLPVASAVAAGGSHACALVRPETGLATIECWGANDDRQLGDGSTSASSVPVSVKGLAGEPVAVSAGARHSCAVTSNGLVECWGANGEGQLGTGVGGDRSDVGKVPGLTEVLAVATGSLHTCAVTRASGVACWGANDYGQLGDGTTRDRRLPVAVGGLPADIASITAGGSHSCALTSAGALLCWGANDAGQLGNSTLVDSAVPIPVKGLSGIVAIDAGARHTCAVRGRRELLCWGANDWGQLGDGTTVAKSLPHRVERLSGPATALGVGEEHTCVALSSGSVECWGFNYFGQLGDGIAPHSGSPTPVAVVGFGADSTRMGRGPSYDRRPGRAS